MPVHSLSKNSHEKDTDIIFIILWSNELFEIIIVFDEEQT